MLLFLVYVSSARTLFTRADLEDLLRTCRANNERLGVSGALLYRDGSLMQVLEGEETTVRGLYDRIARDRRHHGLIVLLEKEQDQRQFPEWSMAFRDLSTDAETMPGFNDFLNTPLRAEEFGADPTAAQQLMVTFKKAFSLA
jgi:hypothetical protein